MNTENTEEFVPETVDYDETDNQRMSAMPMLKEGLFKTAITQAEHGADVETKNLYINVVLSPLNGADQPQQTPTARKRVELPLRNPAIAGHQVQNLDLVKKKFKRFVQAIDPQAFGSLPAPRKNESDGKYYDPEGQVMTKEKWDAYNKKVNDVLLGRAKAWYNTPTTLLGAVCYTFIKRNDQYANVFWMASEPGNYSVITEGFTG